MGLRLQGDPVEVSSPPDRLSAPVAPGAIQIAGGQLIVLGVACGTMGGYPHVAQLISADLDRLGQLRPGDAITFRRVALGEAALTGSGRTPAPGCPAPPPCHSGRRCLKLCIAENPTSTRKFFLEICQIHASLGG